MSTGGKRPLAEAEAVANAIVQVLEPVTQRIAIAGSIRRKKPEVGDIEIIAIPKGEDLYFKLLALVGESRLLPLKGFKPGAKYMQFGTRSGFKLDLFLANPETWGVIYTVRTGSAAFSYSLFKHANSLGYTSQNARIYHRYRGFTIDTPEEKDVFQVLGLEWVRPEDRHDGNAIKPIAR